MFRYLLRFVLPLTLLLFIFIVVALAAAPLLPSHGVISSTAMYKEGRYLHDVRTGIGLFSTPRVNLLPDGFTSWSADYSRVVFLAENPLGIHNGYVMVATVAGSIITNTPITANASALPGSVYFALSPDGTQYAYEEDNRIYIRTVATREERLVHSMGQNMEMDWSPDGKTLAFRSRRQMHDEVYLLDLETLREKPLNKHPVTKFSPAFSPDGRYVAYVADDFHNDDIYVTDLQTGEFWNVSNGGNNYHPEWSPDGEHVIYTRVMQNFGSYIAIVNRDGGAITHITRFSGDYAYPLWLP